MLYENDSQNWPEIALAVRGMEWRRLTNQRGQLPPTDPPDWRVWYIRGGRGGGKTWTGSHQLGEWIQQNPGRDWAVVAPTFGDARDTCMEGVSGLLKALGLSKGYRGWNRSHGELFLPEGGIVYIDGADDGALRIQGKNLAGLWADEVGLWRDWKTAWQESIAFAVRIDPARIIATGTPKRGHQLVKKLMDDPKVAKSVVRTLDNASNLSAKALDDLLARYAGTTLGRQELDGELLGEVEGALVTPDQILHSAPRQHVVNGELVDDLDRVVVAIDPAVTFGEDSDETGIIVTARHGDQGYVLADGSGRYKPLGWASQAIKLYEHYQADAIIGEVNNGGDMVEGTLRGAGFAGRYIKVTATRGKQLRAEPVTGMYEQFRIHHVQPFPELEEQLTTWTPDAKWSPDRMDALVWGFTELFPPTPTISGPFMVNV